MPAVDVADLGRRLRSRHRATCLAAAGKLLASLAASPPGDRPPLRSLLAESIASGSPLVASACAEGLPRVFAPRARAVPAAQQQGYGWDDAATDLAGLLRAATDAARLELAVNAVGRLLEALAAARASGLSEALHEPPPFGGPRSARPHPFFVAAAQEGAWTPLISEVKRLLAAAPDAAAVRVMLEPFIGSVLLPTPENPLVSVDATFLWLRELVHALLHQARKRDSTGDHATAKYLFESAWSALRKAPLTSGGVGERWTYLTADSLVRAVVDSRSPGSPLLAYAPVLFTDVLSVACDVRAQGGVLSRCLELLAELHRAWGAGGAQDGAQDAAKPAGIPNGAAETAVVGLSFLLWTSCSAGESRIITGLLGQVVRQSGVTGYYAALAYLPVLSALPELRDEVVAETLVAIEEAASKPAACAGQPNGTPGTLSSLATTAAHIVRLRDEDITQVPDALSRLSPSWRQLFNSALLLDTVESTRTRALTALFGHLGDPDQEAMRVLPVLLRVLRRDAAPAIRLAVLTKGLPAVGAADAFSGSRVVPIAVELTKKPAAGLASAGTRALVGIWKLQPRAWPALRECLTGWVRQRKARDSGHERRKLSPLGKSGVAAEIAAVTAMRDICVSKAAEHGDQLVPLLVSSLQYICLSKVGRAIALEALNLCVAAGVLEPRAAWNVIFSHAAAFAFLGKGDPRLAERVCDFCILAARKQNASTVYAEFTNSLLVDYLAPACFPPASDPSQLPTSNPSVRAAALTAVAHFPVEDIAALIPSRSREVIKLAMQDSHSFAAAKAARLRHSRREAPGWPALLEALMAHEVEHLGRSLFAKAGSAPGAPAKTAGAPPRPGSERPSRVHDAINFLRDAWTAGRVPPGLRAGCAAAVLAGSREAEKNWAVKDHLRDIKLSAADFVGQAAALRGWKVRFSEMFLSASKKGEAAELADRLESELNVFLEKTTGDPAASGGVVLAMAALVAALRDMAEPSAARRISRLVDFLVNRAPNALAFDEARAAVCVALGCAAAGSDDAVRAARHLLKIASLADEKSGVRAGAALGLGILLSGPASSLIEDGDGKELWARAAETLVKAFTANADAPRVQLGAGIALTMAFHHVAEDRRKEILSVALSRLRDFANLAPDDMTESLAAGAAAAAMCVAKLAGGDDGTSKLIRTARVLAAASHGDVAQYERYIAIAGGTLVRRLSSEIAAELKSELARLEKCALSADERSASVLAATAMIGADILAFARPETGNRDDRPTGEMVVLQAKAVAAVCSAAGLDVEGRRVRPGVKKALAQSALIALGHLAALEIGGRNVPGEDRPAEANFTGEPQDYGKLPAQTSYLRAAFEVLGGSGALPTPAPECATVLLTSLAAVPYPLPPVYWAPVLSRLPLLPSILFACRQSPASRSCVGVLTGRISRPPPDDREARMVLWSEEGLGRVFALAGLETAAKGTAARPLRVRRGESEKRTSLDGKRVADAVKGASEFLFGAGRADVAEQTVFLQTLANHLPAAATAEGAPGRPQANDASAGHSELAGHLRAMVKELLAVLTPPRRSSHAEAALLRLATDVAFARVSPGAGGVGVPGPEHA